MTPVVQFSPPVGHPKAAKNAESGGRPTVILVQGSKGELEVSQWVRMVWMGYVICMKPCK